MGFTIRTGLAEGGSTLQPFTISAAVAIGDIVKVNVSNGQVAPATTDADGLVVGCVVGPADLDTKMNALVNGTSRVMVSTDPDVVFGVPDANARKNGQRLDITGTTGAMGVTTASNNDFVVAADSTADQETLVKLAQQKHYTSAT